VAIIHIPVEGISVEALKIKCEYTELVKINQLVENPKNANKHSKEQIERLAKILDFQGWRHPIIVSKRSGFICAGHGRLLASKLLNQESVPVDYQDFNTEAEEYAFLVADNEIARWAELDEEKFLEDLKDIDLGDIELLGLKDIPTFKDLEINNNSKELDLDEFDNFDHKCPKCNFEWNENDSTT
jgi:ParB-like chromosome segregation protein Spo0J